jgi:mannose-1-phosphate guanylyltransferase
VRAVVLVGGFGTRLRPLTLTTPKQMLPIVHRPMIEHVLEHLASHGIDDAVLSMGYRPDAFADAYPDGRCAGVQLHYAIESEPLDTAGAIRFAALDAGIDDRFVVVNGDVLTDLDLGCAGGLPRFPRRGRDHRPPPGGGPERLRGGAHRRRRSGGGVRGEAASRAEAPTDLINAGTYVLEASVLDRIDTGPQGLDRA